MNVMRSRLNSQSGFSLVELMVVVAIIGILAAVAIPQFSKFQARTRQSEAKAHLSGIYTAQKGFHSEFSVYYGGLRTIGYSPDGGSTAAGAASGLRYNAGFTAAGGPLPATVVAAPNDGFGTLDAAANICTNAGTPQPCVAHTNLSAVPAIVGSVAPTNTVFTAGATGNPNSRTAAGTDTWTIDQNKQLVWAANGID